MGINSAYLDRVPCPKSKKVLKIFDFIEIAVNMLRNNFVQRVNTDTGCTGCIFKQFRRGIYCEEVIFTLTKHRCKSTNKIYKINKEVNIYDSCLKE